MSIGVRIGPAIGSRIGAAIGVGVDPMQAGSSGLAVTKDATSGKYLPKNATEWTTTMAAAGIATGNPSHLWLMQEAASPFADSIGSVTLIKAGTRVDFQQTISGWSTLGARSRGDELSSTSASLADPATTSVMLLAVAIQESPGTPPGADAITMWIGSGTQSVYWTLNTSNVTQIVSSTTTAGTTDPRGSVHPLVLQNDHTAGKARAVTNLEMLEATAATLSGKAVAFNGNLVSNGSVSYLYCAEFEGAAAELTTAQIKKLMQTLGWTVSW